MIQIKISALEKFSATREKWNFYLIILDLLKGLPSIAGPMWHLFKWKARTVSFV